MVSALDSQAKSRGSNPTCGISFYTQVFFFLPFPSIWWDFVGDHLSGWAVIMAVLRMEWAAYKVQ